MEKDNSSRKSARPQVQNGALSDDVARRLAEAIADARDWVPSLDGRGQVEAFIDPQQLALLIAAAESHLAETGALLALNRILNSVEDGTRFHYFVSRESVSNARAFVVALASKQATVSEGEEQVRVIAGTQSNSNPEGG